MVSSGTIVDKTLIWFLVRDRGVEKIYLSPTPSEKPNKNLIHTRISLGFSLGVGGYKKNILYPTPNEKPNKNLIHTRISLGFSVGVGG